MSAPPTAKFGRVSCYSTQGLKGTVKRGVAVGIKGGCLFLGNVLGAALVKGQGMAAHCEFLTSLFHLAGLKESGAFGPQLPITPGNRCPTVDCSLSGLARRVPAVQTPSLVCALKRSWVAVAWHHGPHSNRGCSFCREEGFLTHSGPGGRVTCPIGGRLHM